MPELKDHPTVGEAPRLYEKLSDLFRSTNSVNAAPSPAQRVYFDELTEAFGPFLFLDTPRTLSWMAIMTDYGRGTRSSGSPSAASASLSAATDSK